MFTDIEIMAIRFLNFAAVQYRFDLLQEKWNLIYDIKNFVYKFPLVGEDVGSKRLIKGIIKINRIVVTKRNIKKITKLGRKILTAECSVSLPVIKL